MSNPKILTLSILFTFMITVCQAIDVKDFGAKGDGISDDTPSIIAAIEGAGDGIVKFPRGRYRITRSIEIHLEKSGKISLAGEGGSSVIIMEGTGPAFKIIGTHSRGSANPETISEQVWQNERMPLIFDLEITANHPDADGIELSNTVQAIIRSVLIREMRNGIRLTSRNRNILIEGCHIYNCSNIGIFLDGTNIHQINIDNCHISYNKRSGIKVSGSEIRNFQITGNDIEYNCHNDGNQSADIWIDTSMEGSSVREGAITGNTIQAVPTDRGRNLLFTGNPNTFNKIGQWSITGNHIGNQETNIQFVNVRGINVVGNTILRGYESHIILENSHNIIIDGNMFDHNEDYFPPSVIAKGGMVVHLTSNVIISDNMFEGIENDAAISIHGGQQVTVSDCQLNDLKYSGIEISDCPQAIITNCIIRGNQKTAGGKNYGIIFKGDCKWSMAHDNIIDMNIKNGLLNQSTGRISEESNVNIYTSK